MTLLDLYKACKTLNDNDRWAVMKFWKVCRTYMWMKNKLEERKRDEKIASDSRNYGYNQTIAEEFLHRYGAVIHKSNIK